MQIATSDNIHGGHRERMRERFKTHGERPFDTYELLEMLLYYVVPYKDTNPIAKNLLIRFSSLAGIAGASRDELLSVDGVGERVADFLIGISRSYDEIVHGDVNTDGDKIETHSDAGEMFVRYFDSFTEKEEREKKRIVMALLDSSMHLISLVEPYVGLDFESGAVQSRPFVEAALASNAAIAVLAHNHPHGHGIATPADRETNRMIRNDLLAIDVDLAEHFIISGSDYVSFSEVVPALTFRQNAYLDRFVKDCALYTGSRSAELAAHASLEKQRQISSLIGLIRGADDAKSSAERLSRMFPRISGMLASDFYVISDISSEKTALFLKLFHSISVRRMTEDFEFGKPHTRAEIGRYFAALLGDSQREYTYIMIYDEKRRVTCCDFVSEGTVNTTSLPPRRVIEIAKQRGAVGVSVCHNHPGGSPTPSNVDIDTTKLLFRMFRTVGIVLYDHYVIARGKYCVIGISDDGEETITVSEGKELFPKKTHTYN